MDNKIRILIPDDLPQECLSIFKSADFEVIFNPAMPPEDILEAVKEADGMVVRSKVKVTREIIESGDRLKLIGRAGVGYDNIDVAAATEKGIAVMNVPGANAVSVAELTLAMMLMLARNLIEANQSTKAGKWEKKRLKGNEIMGKTLGLLGLGMVGVEVAKRGIGFGMKVIANDPRFTPDSDVPFNVKIVGLDELLAQSDYISLHLPLNESTRHMFNEDMFQKCKKGVRIINCARGGIIDENALYRALQSGQVAGAALDVFEKEPPKESPLRDLPNVIMTPHIGASTVEAQIRVATKVARQMVEFFKEEKIENVVNPEAILK
ncbi:MAG: hydroxyacid dehydrogenase [Calditrichaeota bacterium]|nr:hydroxyacid dehydrogenase [Calditrichota bacterium]